MTESSGLRNKDGSISKMRSHKGNVPTLPQTKACPHCSARFTRSTHLTRHMKNHTNERQYKCQTCPSEFTRSDLLARHRKHCEDPSRPTRLRSCILCTESKVKCDRNDPCSRCKSKGRDCSFSVPPRKKPSPDESIGAPSGSTTSDSSAVASISGNSTSATLENPDQAATFLPLESISEELVDLLALKGPEPVPPLVQSHLSRVYDDAFGSLFTDVFSTFESPASLDDSSFSLLPSTALEELPLQTGTQQPWFQELLIHQDSLPHAEVDQRSLLNDFFGRDLNAADPRHYLYLFFNTFISHMPVVHTATFTLEGKPPYLVKAMKACGAIFVRTRKASTYITDSLAAAREGLAQAFATTLMEPIEQIYLVIAVVLLQTVGLWHQKPDERAMSSLYHGMLVTMIRRAGLILQNSAWSPTQTDNIQTMWQEWAFHEMTKRHISTSDPSPKLMSIRALLLSWLHDCCQPIFFGLPPSYPGEMQIQMPCEDALWKAGSAEEWFSVLQAPSLNLSSECRLTGLDMRTSLASMNGPQFIPTPNLSRYCHFVLIHGILRDLFAACSDPINLASDPGEDVPSEAMLSAQYALHNWLHSWTICTNHMRSAGDPWFFNDGLPFYWLGQVAILARQEGLPPFNSDSARSEAGEVRFKMVKRWLRHIRAFLREGDESTLFWDELMKIQLQSWQLQYDSDGGLDDQDGLLAFFPDP
ncbi:hypothetical protein K438DRAFT_1729871 [Mycena galopus ATCC 62051]|nr:hypothetical protein K438DRAFT_1729871 [Mycena galopus ATCC 62051]